MIQAGTIRIGSARTFSVAGAYWMSSISRLRKTTLPGAVATSTPTPTRKASVPAGGWPVARRRKSSTMFCQPATKFAPPLPSVRSRISGLVKGVLDGAKRSRIWRAAKATTC
jgi:hypothetical protein